MDKPSTIAIPAALYSQLLVLGIIDASSIRQANVGESNYSEHLIQPWAIWQDYNLNPWDADIIKRVLRSKGNSEESIAVNRILDYKKIIHICQERLRQLESLSKVLDYGKNTASSRVGKD